MNERDGRPWGFFEVLAEGPDYKVKRVVVLPGKRLSLQRHLRRAEHWHVVSGVARVTVDRRDVTVAAGGSLDIPVGVAHRVANSGDAPVVIVEVQRGDYLGEDDIERLEDDFGRA